jgi:hypothetical protein
LVIHASRWHLRPVEVLMSRSKLPLAGAVLILFCGCATARPMLDDGPVGWSPAPASAVVHTTGAEVPAAAARPAAFDRAMAARLVGAVIERANACQSTDGPTGKGHAILTFAPDGTVSGVELDEPFRDTEVGRCVIDELRQISVRPFAGGPVTVGKAFEISPQG